MVLDNIKHQPAERREVLEKLYIEAFPGVARYVGKMGGSFEEARDIFHDALMIYMEKSQMGIEIKYGETSYLTGIAKHLWSRRFNELNKLHSGKEDKLPDDAEEEYSEAAAPGLMELLTTAGQKCMELLSAFYYEQLDMEKLAQRFGFSGTRSATVQKFKCLEKVRETVKTKSLQYEDFME